ncbi:MAG TPA: HAD hydrolase-like protein [Streptosporangiaceae bacterium]|nr:HAD hydrolase-like protein [Streptosporangiaceae bacterium]
MRPTLVLWDIDYTLVQAGPVGRVLYEIVLAELYGVGLPAGLASMAGRTDCSIAAEVLTAAGLDPAAELPRFHRQLAARAPELSSMVREHGVVLPGARAALAAVAVHRPGGPVVQSLLTGNIPALASVKLGALGLTDHLDLQVGAYGDVSEIRADLVSVARRNAAARYGADFGGRATVLVGDTPHDVQAALITGARAVAVATGRFSAQQLAETGADVVLADLTATDEVVAAILDGDGAEPKPAPDPSRRAR